jgi:hypothetical protein
VLKALRPIHGRRYQSTHGTPADSVYHSTLVGPDFFHKTGGVLRNRAAP